MFVTLYKAWTYILPFLRRTGVSAIEVSKSVKGQDSSMPMLTYQFNMRTKGTDMFHGCIVRSAQMLLSALLAKKGHTLQQMEQWFDDAKGKFSFDEFLKSRDESATMRWWSATDAVIALTELCRKEGYQVSDDEVSSVSIFTLHLSQGEDGMLDEESVSQLIRMSDNPRFVGAVGGVGHKGFMFTSFCKDKSEIVDPHAMITDASLPFLTLSEYKSSFFLRQDEAFVVDTRRISPSICICLA